MSQFEVLRNYIYDLIFSKKEILKNCIVPLERYEYIVAFLDGADEVLNLIYKEIKEIEKVGKK